MDGGVMARHKPDDLAPPPAESADAPDREAGEGDTLTTSAGSEPARTNGTSKRRFTVIVGCDYGKGYKAPGAVVDDVPATSVAQSLAEGVLVPEGEDLPPGVVPIPQQASYTYHVLTEEADA